jgi:endonuclease/exonuclease/phosphatase family metal-dependent hydrolase
MLIERAARALAWMRSSPIVAGVLWSLVACWGLWVLVRLLGLDDGFPLVPLMALTPEAMIAVIATVGLAVLLRRPAAASVAFVIVILFAAAIAPRILPGPGERTSGRPLRVVSANLLHGHADPEALIDLVRTHHADVLSVQELTPSEVRRLRLLGLEKILPHQVLSVRLGVFGTGLYSRYPMRRLHAPRSFFKMARAVMAIPGYGPVRAVAVHPRAPVGFRTVGGWSDDLQILPEGVEPGPPWLLAGDFNATLDHSELRGVIDSGYFDAADAEGDGLDPTWSAGNLLPPPVTIDHILISRSGGISDYAVDNLPGSDHEAIYAEVRLPPRPSIAAAPTSASPQR